MGAEGEKRERKIGRERGGAEGEKKERERGG